MKPNMEELFETLPEVPEGFEDGCMKWVHPVPIYYRRKGRYAECICGKCGLPYKTDIVPNRYDFAVCEMCGASGQYEWMKCTNAKIQYFTVVLVQTRTDKNLALRHFKCTNTFKIGSRQKFTMREETRFFMNMGDFYKFNRVCTYDDGREIWGTGQAGMTYADYLYPGYLEAIQNSNLKYFKQGHHGLINELKAYSRNPALEMFKKMGLWRLSDELIEKEGRCKYINRRGKTVKEQLRLRDGQRIKELVNGNGNMLTLRILQMEEKAKTRLTEEQREWIREKLTYWNGDEGMKLILKYTTFRKMYNRLSKYEKAEGATTGYARSAIFRRYIDYLSMREELGYDMTNEVFLFPKDLKAKHDEMVAEKNARNDAIYAIKKEKEFGNIRERFADLMKEYGYENGAYLIRPAGSATEIINEGRTLHHCVGRMGYMEKHSKGQSFILFLRRKEEPEVPYYTIEIRKKDILQWYGEHDKKPDRETIGPWLNEYIAHLGGTQSIA